MRRGQHQIQLARQRATRSYKAPATPGATGNHRRYPHGTVPPTVTGARPCSPLPAQHRVVMRCHRADFIKRMALVPNRRPQKAPKNFLKITLTDRIVCAMIPLSDRALFDRVIYKTQKTVRGRCFVDQQRYYPGAPGCNHFAAHF